MTTRAFPMRNFTPPKAFRGDNDLAKKLYLLDPSKHLILGEPFPEEETPRANYYRRYQYRHGMEGYFVMNKDDLAQHANVFGLTGTGKTTFLEEIVDQLRSEKMGKIPVLIINLAKENQHLKFGPDIVTKYGELGLQAPYIPTLPKDRGKLESCLEHSSNNLVATMGFKHEIKRILPIVMMNWVNQKKKLPTSIKTLFRSLVDYIKKYKYAGNFQVNVLRTTYNRIKYIVKNKPLVQSLKYLPDIPWWFKKWMAGDMVFIDLSPCDSVARQLLTYSIFQLVRSYIPRDETNELKYLIIIDEAHKILREPTSRDHNDVDYITKNQTQAIIEELLMEFRSMGVGMIIADQQPSSLMKCAYSLASNRFLFRLNHPCYKLFSTNKDEWEAISRLENRQLLAIVNGKDAAMNTIDKSDMFMMKLVEL
ncbi:MAG: hypothetical protein ACFFCS_20115 [Candidatus Hodarchaeota archaeon]